MIRTKLDSDCTKIAKYIPNQMVDRIPVLQVDCIFTQYLLIFVTCSLILECKFFNICRLIQDKYHPQIIGYI